ncbi:MULTISPECIES: DUF1345 domain-containing protein [Acinetobacter]|uniref:DUF1345 domain-containing protein n=1 Tax=Acinetobacter nematophilus TaxID=2994642 RepID=A0A9X3DTR7_9GAMM|nr:MULTISPECIES: DUF1345 domain-containing protein [unclassified Acinetobacter]MBJ9952416.1 DUF1345 domain-containing protein [Acinetobacter baumannii]MCX5468300.1 DUF1345 domain-containing protein [Acinetobacter nematophilus]
MALSTFHHIRSGIRSRPYFFIAFLFTMMLYVVFGFITDWSWSTRLLSSWNIAVMIYLLLTLKTLWSTSQAHILKRAQQQDASKWIILLLVIFALVMCFIAIVIELTHMPHHTLSKFGHLVLAILTIISAWLFMHTVFAIHYAHDYYLAVAKHQQGGLDFPQTPEPTYPDFLYFSYVIGTSAQTADVSITSRPMRVLNILHILLAYGFNTTILAICINVAASLI